MAGATSERGQNYKTVICQVTRKFSLSFQRERTKKDYLGITNDCTDVSGEKEIYYIHKQKLGSP